MGACGVGVALSSSKTQAQPAEAPVTDAQRQAGEQKRDAFLKQGIDPLVATDATAALSAAQNFVAANTDLVPQVRLGLYREVGARVFGSATWNAPVSSKQRDAQDEALLKFLDEGLQDSSQAPGIPPGDRLPLQRLAIILLLRHSRMEQVQQRLEAAWPDAMNNAAFGDWVKLRRDFLVQQGQEAQVVPMMLSAIELRLQGQHQFDPLLCQIMAEVLRDQGQSAQSLSWAKLNFMLCYFNDGETSAAAQALARTWTYDLSSDQVKAFAAAQTDASSPNPLQGVALPAFDAKLTELLKTATGQAKTLGDSQAVISLLIVQGDFTGAMRQARSHLASDMGSEDSVRQVARVFKAKDLNLVRANEFLSFYGSGKGPNPMTAFFQAQETTSAATTPAATTPAVAPLP